MKQNQVRKRNLLSFANIDVFLQNKVSWLAPIEELLNQFIPIGSCAGFRFALCGSLILIMGGGCYTFFTGFLSGCHCMWHFQANCSFQCSPVFLCYGFLPHHFLLCWASCCLSTLLHPLQEFCVSSNCAAVIRKRMKKIWIRAEPQQKYIWLCLMHAENSWCISLMYYSKLLDWLSDQQVF